jgi:hypothetical protein
MPSPENTANPSANPSVASSRTAILLVRVHANFVMAPPRGLFTRGRQATVAAVSRAASALAGGRTVDLRQDRCGLGDERERALAASFEATRDQWH